MKKISILFLLAIASVQAFAQVSAQKMVDDLLLKSRGGVFRGLEFTTYDSELDSIENYNGNVVLNYEDYSEDYEYKYVGYDLEYSTEEYAYIDYVIDLTGMVEVYCEIYPATNTKATEVFNILKKHCDTKYGAGTAEDDGWISYEGEYLGDPFSVWIGLNGDDESGKYVSFELYYEGDY
jgi:hypothetical protein